MGDSSAALRDGYCLQSYNERGGGRWTGCPTCTLRLFILLPVPSDPLHPRLHPTRLDPEVGTTGMGLMGLAELPTVITNPCSTATRLYA